MCLAALWHKSCPNSSESSSTSKTWAAAAAMFSPSRSSCPFRKRPTKASTATTLSDLARAGSCAADADRLLRCLRCKGLGTICLSIEELHDQARLDQEAAAYAAEFCGEEDTETSYGAPTRPFLHDDDAIQPTTDQAAVGISYEFALVVQKRLNANNPRA